MAAPVDLAEIVEDRQRRRRGEVGIGDARPGQPVARAGQPVGVFHVLAHIGARRADRARIGRAAAQRLGHQRLQHAFAHQMPRHLALGLDQIPVGEPADFGAVHRVLGKQPAVALQNAAGLVEIFGDDMRADDRHVALRKQHRQRAGGVQRQEFLAPRPRLFLDQRQFLADTRRTPGGRSGRSRTSDGGKASA